MTDSHVFSLSNNLRSGGQFKLILKGLDDEDLMAIRLISLDRQSQFSDSAE